MRCGAVRVCAIHTDLGSPEHAVGPFAVWSLHCGSCPQSVLEAGTTNQVWSAMATCCAALSLSLFGFAAPTIAAFAGIVNCSTTGKIAPAGKLNTICPLRVALSEQVIVVDCLLRSDGGLDAHFLHGEFGSLLQLSIEAVEFTQAVHAPKLQA